MLNCLSVLFSSGCFMNVTRGGGGLIHSPNHPHKYLINTTCEWHIYSTSPYGRILLQFVSFAMEGSLQQCEYSPSHTTPHFIHHRYLTANILKYLVRRIQPTSILSVMLEAYVTLSVYMYNTCLIKKTSADISYII